MDEAIKPTSLQKSDEFVKSINGQGNEVDGLTKNDRFIKSIKSINRRGYKADDLTKNDRITP